MSPLQHGPAGLAQVELPLHADFDLAPLRADPRFRRLLAPKG